MSDQTLAGSSTSVRPGRNGTAPVGAVVIGGDYQGLGIVRSLGRRGIPTCVVDDEHSIARHSRYSTHAVHVGDLRNEQAVVSTVLEIGARLGLRGWVLYPTRDETVAAFSRNRSRLEECFRVPTPEWEATRWAWDKRNTYRLAQELGIPTPMTRYPRDEAELAALDLAFPLTVKPAIKEHFFYATKAKAWRADDRNELMRRFRQAAVLVPPGEIMIQDLIPGDGREQFAYCAFFKDGAAVASMVVRRRRQHPPDFGRASTYVETIHEPQLEKLSERFLAAIDYYGLVEIEYKRDPRDGLFKLLDFNARTWGYHSIGAHAGVDFPYLLYSDQLDKPVAQCRATPGISWIRLMTDLPTALVELARRRLSLGTYIATLRDSDVEAVFSPEDLRPGLAELLLIPYLFVRRGF
jgi:D-aspartate ligase